MRVMQKKDCTVLASASKNESLVTHNLLMRSIVLQACSIWLATRLLLVLLTYVAALFIARHVSGPLQPDILLKDWSQQDANFYLAIAYYGYTQPWSIVFYPLYPLLIHLASLGNYQYELIVAMLISNLATLATFIGLGVLASREEKDASVAPYVLRVAAAYPLAFLLATPYTEGLFLALAVWIFVFMRQGHWWCTVACAFLAGLTRPTAVILVLPLFWEYGAQKGWWPWLREHWQKYALPLWKPALAKNLLQAGAVVGAIPLGLACFACYCYARFNDPLLFIHAEHLYWYRQSVSPWLALWNTLMDYSSFGAWPIIQARFLADLLPFVCFFALTLCTIQRNPFSFTLYMLGLLYLCIMNPIFNGPYAFSLLSACRFLVVAIPMFLLLGRWIRGRVWLDTLVVGGGFMLQALLTVLYLQGIIGWL